MRSRVPLCSGVRVNVTSVRVPSFFSPPEDSARA